MLYAQKPVTLYFGGAAAGFAHLDKANSNVIPAEAIRQSYAVVRRMRPSHHADGGVRGARPTRGWSRLGATNDRTIPAPFGRGIPARGSRFTGLTFIPAVSS